MRARWRRLIAFAILCGFGLALAVFGAAMVDAQVSAASSASVGGVVTDDHGTVEGVQVDLFAADAQGNRTEWLRTAATGLEGLGTYRFEVEPGCYAVTVIAPLTRTFTNGSRWSNKSLCIAEGESRLDINATLTSGLASSVSGTIYAEGTGPFGGVTVDLFTAQADGSRGEWLRSRTSGTAEGIGTYRFDGLSGCNVLTYVFESDDYQFVESGTTWVNRLVCAEPGLHRERFDVFLVRSDVPPEGRLTVNVLRGDSAAPGVTVDLFGDPSATGDRGQFISSAVTDEAGAVTFEVERGCYVATLVAPDGELWQDSRTRWLNRAVCVIDSPAVDLGTARLAGPSQQSNILDVAVTKQGAIVGGVVVDVFAADASGGRGEFLASGTTAPDRRTTFNSDIGHGCRIITMVAPDFDVFEETGTRWLNRPFCTSPDRGIYRFDAILAAQGACIAGGEFALVFRDDFDGVVPSTDDWSVLNSSGNAGFGLRRPSAVTLENGLLVITADMDARNGVLISGGLLHRLDQQYGKYRFRVRTDEDPSQAMSGVVLTWPESGVHPRDGENSVYETLVQTPERNPFFSFIGKPFGSAQDLQSFIHEADASQFQTMTMEWTPGRITITREGPGGSQFSETHVINETEADLIPDNPHRLAIQLDAWKHVVGSAVRMEMDWVEVHQYCG